jgi:hypothetical protein
MTTGWLSKAELRMLAATANDALIHRYAAKKARQSRVLAEITMQGKYADGTRFYRKRDARSSVHQCR